MHIALLILSDPMSELKLESSCNRIIMSTDIAIKDLASYMAQNITK